MVHNKEKNILIFKYIAIIILSSLPINIYIIFSSNVDYNIFKYLYCFVAFYMFSFSLLFQIDNFNYKTIVTTFLSFLLICLLNFSFSFFNSEDLFSLNLSNVFNSEDIVDSYSLILQFFQKNIFLFIIFFIILMLSYIDFNILNTQKQAEFFTVVGDTLFCLILLLTASSIFMMIFFYSFFIFLATIFVFFASSSFTEFLISKGVISIMLIIYSSIPFIAYAMNRSFKFTISYYISRFLMIVLFLLSFIFIRDLLGSLNNYSNKALYYMLFVIVNMFFIRLDLKSSIIIKIVYFLLLLSSFVVCSLMIVNNVYYIIENSFNYMFILKIFILVHISFLLYLAIKDLIIFLKNNSIKDIKYFSINTNSLSYIYVYLFVSILYLFPFVKL